MSEILIRPASCGDASAVYRLLRLIGDLHREGRGDMFPNLESKYTEAELLKRFSESDNGVFIVDVGGSAVGYIFCDVINEGIGTTLYVDDLCVDPDYRNRGIATALMDYASNYGRQKGCRMLMLNVWEFNESACRFYENYGLKTRTRHLEKTL